jgi:uncharacterized membrane protein YgaE (UPF0421/DUF939 family)
VRTAISILLALTVVHLLQLPHGDWVVISAFIVSQDTIGNTLWKAKGRFLGTVFGAIAAILFYGLIRQHHSLIFITAFLTIFPYLYLRPSVGNYGYAKFFQQFAFICFLGTISQQPSAELMQWRAIDIAIGCILGITVAIFVLPNWAQPRWKRDQLEAWTNLHIWFKAIVCACQSPAGNCQHLTQLSRDTQNRVFQLEEHLVSRQHELMIQPKEGYHWAALMRSQGEIVQAYRRIYQSLLYLGTLVQSAKPANLSIQLSAETQEVIRQMSAAFEQMGAAIGTRSPLELPLLHNVYGIADAQENRKEKLIGDELNVFLQLNQVWAAIIHYSEVRNQFLSLLAHKP